jgi:L-asparagine transporter-like permease
MDPVGIVTAILFLALVGFLVYLIVTYIPMPEIFKQVIMVVVAVLLILYIMTLLPLGNLHRPL